MNRDRWISVASIIAAAGGLSWLAKLVVIFVKDGRVVDNGFAALFYLLGLTLLVVGSTSVSVLLTGTRSRLVLVIAVIFSPIAFIVSFLVLDSLAKFVVGDRGPTYIRDEAGILATALVWLVIGVVIAGMSRRPQQFAVA